MAFIQSDPTLDLTTAEGRRAQLKALLAARAEEGAMPRGDIEVLETEFVEYTDEGELTVRGRSMALTMCRAGFSLI